MIKNIFRSPILYCILLLVLVVVGLLGVEPKIENVHAVRGGVEKDVSLPYSEGMGRMERFQVKMDVVPSWMGSIDVKIIPDDCVKALYINDVEFDVKKYPGYCEWSKGFTISADDIEEKVGESSSYHISMELENGGGFGGISAFAFSSGTMKTFLEILALILVAVLTFLVGCKIHVEKKLLFLLVLGVFLRIAYTQNTSYRERSYDVDGHLEYINIVADQHRIPDAKECWSCYHPILYYAGMTPVKYAANGLGVSAVGTFQWCSFFMSVAMLILGLAVLKHACSGGTFWLGAILWTFWPGNILSVPRIGNDIPFYLAHVLSLWGCARYMATNKGGFLLTAVLTAFVAYWSKTTGAITIGLVGLTMCIHFIPRFFTFRKKFKLEYVSVGAFVALSSVIALMILTGNGLIANTGNLNGSLRVGNDPGSFLYFDIPGFLTHPFTSAWRDGLGREYFWNYLAKTSLFGEFNLTNSELGIWLASVISFVFIIFLVVGIMGVWKMKWNKMNVLLGVQGIVFLLAEAYLRYKYPYSCSNDFRFIIPGMISYTYAVGNGFFEGNSSVRFKTFGSILVVSFALCSAWLLLIL